MYNLKEFTSKFNQLARLQQHTTVFNCFLDFVLLAFKVNYTEEEMANCLKRAYHENAKQIFTEMLLIIGDLADADGKGLADPLGEFFMLEISRGHNGQYFTPETVCDFMTSIVAVEELEEQKHVLDPACGSGRMLLSAAKMNRNLLFYGADIDNTCVKMAAINMLMNGLSGEICQLNSISNEFFCGYKIGIHKIFGIPSYQYFTDPAESRIHLKITADMADKLNQKKPHEKPPKGNSLQGLLFTE